MRTKQWAANVGTASRTWVIDDESSDEGAATGHCANMAIMVDDECDDDGNRWIIDDQADGDDVPILYAQMHKEIHTPRFKFGQYKDEPYDGVTKENSSYYFWGSTQKAPSKYLVHYLRWVEDNYCIDKSTETLWPNGTERPQDVPESARGSKPYGIRKGATKFAEAAKQWTHVETCKPACDPSTVTHG